VALHLGLYLGYTWFELKLQRSHYGWDFCMTPQIVRTDAGILCLNTPQSPRTSLWQSSWEPNSHVGSQIFLPYSFLYSHFSRTCIYVCTYTRAHTHTATFICLCYAFAVGKASLSKWVSGILVGGEGGLIFCDLQVNSFFLASYSL
jgi:hypothetical protein